DAVLVGTTDERFEQRPEHAIASEAELDYLVRMVNEVFPDITLQRSDIALHYSGVRPLGYAPRGKPAGVSRDHSIDVRQSEGGFPILTLVGGKLTTCRALGEIAADAVLAELKI